jgi:hypothetical protein
LLRKFYYDRHPVVPELSVGHRKSAVADLRSRSDLRVNP